MSETVSKVLTGEIGEVIPKYFPEDVANSIIGNAREDIATVNRMVKEREALLYETLNGKYLCFSRSEDSEYEWRIYSTTEDKYCIVSYRVFKDPNSKDFSQIQSVELTYRQNDEQRESIEFFEPVNILDKSENMFKKKIKSVQFLLNGVQYNPNRNEPSKVIFSNTYAAMDYVSQNKIDTIEYTNRAGKMHRENSKIGRYVFETFGAGTFEPERIEVEYRTLNIDEQVNIKLHNAGVEFDITKVKAYVDAFENEKAKIVRGPESLTTQINPDYIAMILNIGYWMNGNQVTRDATFIPEVSKVPSKEQQGVGMGEITRKLPPPPVHKYKEDEKLAPPPIDFDKLK